MKYQRTQVAVLPLVGFAILETIVLLAVILSSDDDWLTVFVIIGVASLIGVVLAVFSRLTVEVHEDEIAVSFGWGWPKKRISFTELVGAHAVRNKWWYGFGIRLIPNGLMWNVWGLDAVALNRVNGKEFRIGTNAPDELLAALIGRVPIS